MGYSAIVNLELRVQDEVLDVAQSGSSMLILREPRVLPAGPAQLVITIDGRAETYEIVLNPGSGEPARKYTFW